MSVLRAATLKRFGELMEDVEGVQLSQLPPSTTLLVRTMNTLYRVVIKQWPEVDVQGGDYFPDPTSARLDGASIGGSLLRADWIGVGLRMEIRAGDRRILTSRVCAITTEPASDGVEPQPAGGSTRMSCTV